MRAIREGWRCRRGQSQVRVSSWFAYLDGEIPHKAQTGQGR